MPNLSKVVQDIEKFGSDGITPVFFVANDDGSNSATIDLIMHNKDGGPTENPAPTKSIEIAKTVSIPPGATAVILDKNSALYLEEDHSIYATASAANDLNVFCSYEEIS